MLSQLRLAFIISGLPIPWSSAVLIWDKNILVGNWWLMCFACSNGCFSEWMRRSEARHQHVLCPQCRTTVQFVGRNHFLQNIQEVVLSVHLHMTILLCFIYACFLSFLVTISENVMLGYIESGYRTEAANWRSRSVRLIFINPIKSCKYLLQYLRLSNWFCKYIKHLLSRWLSHYHFLNTVIVFLVQLVVSYTYLTCCLKYHNLHTF